MTAAWLKDLIQHHRPKLLPDELLQVHGEPKWEGKALHVMLYKSEGLQSKVGHIYPGAEWVTEEGKPRIIHFKLYGGDAQHYAQQFNQRLPERSLVPESPASPNPIDESLRTLARNCDEKREYGKYHDGEPYVILNLPDSKAVNRALWTLQSAREDGINVNSRDPQLRPTCPLKVSLRGSWVSAFDQQLALHQSRTGQPIDTRGPGASR
jgi:hypothetical protein